MLPSKSGANHKTTVAAVSARRVLGCHPARFRTVLKRADQPIATPQRNGPEDAEAAIDESPRDRDTPHVTCNECERDHSCASDQAKRNNLPVANRVAVGADEGEASTRWAKASQSVPYARNGYRALVSESA